MSFTVWVGQFHRLGRTVWVFVAKSFTVTLKSFTVTFKSFTVRLARRVGVREGRMLEANSVYRSFTGSRRSAGALDESQFLELLYELTNVLKRPVITTAEIFVCRYRTSAGSAVSKESDAIEQQSML